MAPEDRVPRSGERYPRERLPDDRSLGDLLSELTQETRTLVRQEITLARTELGEKASEASQDAAYIGVGGAVAYAGFIAIVFALVFLLANVMPVWLSSLIVGVVVAGIGYALVQRGLTALKRMDFSLSRTSESLKEDKQWMKEEVKGREASPGGPQMSR